MTPDHSQQETVLVERNDPYLDYALARYGTATKACAAVYGRGDSYIRSTFLAHFPNGGFAQFFQGFEPGPQMPRTVDELRALVTNKSLTDALFQDCFEKKGPFEHLSDEEFQTVIVSAADNPRLHTPYDDTYLDG